ncbi:MAG: hypothetical protein HY453_01250 [Parcubacteria group bacterium]|nr:hypothetical protein [Parcubacteria group bacterium]
MTRKIAEISNGLSVFFLKKHGFLPQGDSWRNGGIKWTWDDWQSNIGFSVQTQTDDNSGYIELNYTVTDGQSNEKTEMKYKIKLVTTSCNYGGKRYWFECPLTTNGEYCGRRVGVIYSVGKLFGCRYCANVAYRAQFESGKYRVGSSTKLNIQDALTEATTRYYNGKPTRKFRRYLRLRERLEIMWAKIAEKLDIIQ